VVRGPTTENDMTLKTTLALALAPLLFLAACTDAAKAPAEAALKAGEAAVATLTEEASKLAPAQVQAAKDALASAKALAAKQDYKAALAAAGEIPVKVKEAVAAVQAKKEEAAKALAAAQKAFADATAALPGQLAAIKARLASLSKAKALPKGVTKATLGQAKTAYAALEDGMAKVKAKAETDLAGATADAGALAKKAADLAKQLKMK
jgi:colicin import membrane protein